MLFVRDHIFYGCNDAIVLTWPACERQGHPPVTGHESAVEDEEDDPGEEGPIIIGPPIIIEESVLKAMPVATLRLECRKRGLPIQVNNNNISKQDLLASLRDAVPEAMIRKLTQTLGGWFHPDARWEVLPQCDTPVDEPEVIASTEEGLRNPTVPVGEPEPTRKNIDWSCSIPDCTAADSAGGPKKKWIEDNNLSTTSPPLAWLEALRPPKTFEVWTNYTNTKAVMQGMGPGGNKYPKFTPFSTEEIARFIGLYTLQGICPSTQIHHKFESSRKDPAGGNNLCHRVFGGSHSNAHSRLKEFKCALAVQNPLLMPPSAAASPTFKVDPLLRMLQINSQNAYDMGQQLAGDEQTCGFQGRSVFKLRITYKREGDGFQCDALCLDGYTYCFYFRQSPPPAKWTEQGFGSLHARSLALLEQLPCDWHRVTFDNLYISAKFVKAAYKIKVLVSGIARKGMRGVPKCVHQADKLSAAAAQKARGTLKAAVLKGDPDVKNMVAVSCYDTKPVYFMSTAATSIQWTKKERHVFCHRMHKLITLAFLRLNLFDEYNFNMGSVDIADQLRGVYRLDKNMRKWKWWWAILFWALGVFMVNAYVLNKMYMLGEGTAKKNLLTHYEFRRSIALALLDPESYDPTGKARYKRTLRSTAAPTANGAAETETSENEDSTTTSVVLRQRITYNKMGPRGSVSHLVLYLLSVDILSVVHSP